MGTVSSAPRHSTLKDWEAYLAPQVRQVELLGEIPITADECGQLGKVIGLRVRTLGHSQAMRTLRHDYPCAFAVYLVAQGIYGYQGGDYWSEVVQVTGLSRNYTWQVGQAFEEILEDLGLPLFYDMRAEAHRYVSLILAHGGVPNYCLPDFFKNILQPSVLRVQYADMSAAELIDEWQWRSSVQYFTDKPVIRFLAYGSQVAQDFVDRCREMAWECLDSGSVPEAEEVGLPERVLDAYRHWISEQSADQVQRETADRWRLRKPEVLVDPWGEGVILDLPPQQVPATMIYTDVAWQVTSGEESYSVPVRVRRTGFDLKTTAETVSLSQPAATYEVSLLADGQVKRTWRYQGVDEKRPLLAFDPERGTLLSWQHSLPARRLGLLYPGQFDLEVEGEAELLEELPRLPWGWAGFCGQMWDLSRATRLILLRDGETVLTATLRPDESAQRPYLIGGQLLSPEQPGISVPVYVGPPPYVRIPLTGRRDIDEELVRWRLTVRNKWSAIPEVQAATTLADLRSQLTVTERHVDLPLNLPSLLGEAPCGNFLVRLRGPLGRSVELTLRIWPWLEVSGHEALYIPDAQTGPPSVELCVRTAPGDEVECQAEDSEYDIQSVDRHAAGHWEHVVLAAPETTTVELTIVKQLSSSDSVRVPLRVPIRRLRWALIGEQAGPTLREWSGQIIKRPVEALLQTEAPNLLIDLPADDAEAVQMVLRLLDIDGAELQRLDAAPSRQGQQRWRFDLSAFRDTVRSSRSPILRFELVGWNLPGQDEPIRLPVLSLTRALVVEDVRLRVYLEDDCPLISLTWREPAPLRNRCVRFWPLWRPWDDVFEQAIPDNAEGALTFEVTPKGLHSAKYRLEFLVVDPWTPVAAPQRPEPETPGTVDIALVSPSEQLRHLDETIQKKSECFDLLLERAIIRHEIGDHEGSSADRQWCYEHVDDGTIPQILALRDLAEKANDPSTLKALQMKMFAVSRVERLLGAHEGGDLSPEHFRAYLDNLPRSGLLPVRTCEKLLAVEDDKVRLHTVQQLIHRSVTSGIDAVLERVRTATLSDDDAIALFKLNSDFAVDVLEKRVNNPTVRRLFKVLARDVSDKVLIVHPGVWVRSDVGWGRIVRIEDPASQAPVESFMREQRAHRLYVTLRPDLDAETIILDLPKRHIIFPDAECVYTCTKCYSFSAQDCYLIIGEHNNAAHGGVGPRHVRERGTTRLLKNLEYSAKRPRDTRI